MAATAATVPAWQRLPFHPLEKPPKSGAYRVLCPCVRVGTGGRRQSLLLAQLVYDKATCPRQGDTCPRQGAACQLPKAGATCPTCQWQFGLVDTLRPTPRRRDCDIWPNTRCFISSEFEYIEWQPMRVSTTPGPIVQIPQLQRLHTYNLHTLLMASSNSCDELY